MAKKHRTSRRTQTRMPRRRRAGGAGGRRSRPAPEDEAQGVRAGDETPARRAGRHAGVGQGVGSQDLHRVRGPRHRREGRHDQADHRAGEPACVPGRCPARPDRAREVADVHAAVHPALPGRRRGRDLRPQLVQPGGRRAGDGLLHAGGDRAVPRAGAGGREGHGRFRDPAAEVLARGQRRRADPAAARAASTTRGRSGSCRTWT